MIAFGRPMPMTMSIKTTSFGAALTIALVVGCGHDESGNGVATADQFIAQVCAEYADCCVAAGFSSNEAQCRSVYGAFAPKAGYDASAGSACLAEIRALGPSKCESVSTGSATPSCSEVYLSTGTKAPGEACLDDSECAPSAMGDTHCATGFAVGATIMQCQVLIRGEEGSSPCVASADEITTFPPGLVADGSIPPLVYVCDAKDGLTCYGGDAACRPIAAVGEACAGGLNPCVPSAYCDVDLHCKTRLALGETCLFDSDCVSSAYCESASSSCTPQVATGEACSERAQCESGNCTNQKCQPLLDATMTLLCGSR